MKQLNKEAMFNFLMTVLSILYGIVIYTLGVWGKSDHGLDYEVLANAITSTVTVGLLFYLVQEVLELKRNITPGVQLDKKVEKFVRKSGGEDSVNGKIGLRLTKKLSKSLDIDEDGTRLSVNDEWWALDTYESFWESLREKQQLQIQKKSTISNQLHCRAIHSSDIKLWLGDRGQTFLKFQEEFVGDGGKIERILCGTDVEPGKEFKEVAKQMKNARIDVYYYCYNPKNNAVFGEFRFLWDFLIVDNQSVMWVVPHIGGQPQKAVYTNDGKYDGQNLSELWRTIRQESKPFPSEKESTAENVNS